LLPGWASSTEILKSYAKSKQCLSLEHPCNDQIIAVLKSLNIDNLSFQFMTFSMGGFVLHDCLKKLVQKESGLELLKNCQAWHAFGLRPAYPLKDVEKVRQSLLKNPAQFLKLFFENEGQDCQKTPFKNFIEEFDLERLLAGLNYLESAHLDADFLNSLEVPCFFYQGTRDKIAPFREMKLFSKKLTKHRLIPLKGSHFSFQDV